jgi:predicted small lipoprotein YifL
LTFHRPERAVTRPLRTFAGLVLLLAAAASASGCGRRGPLEPPPGAQQRQAEAGSDFAAGASFAPPRRTDVELTEGAADGVPPTPVIDSPGAAAFGTAVPGQPQAISGSSAGLGSGQRNARRSPPPRVPFILDPLL